MYVNILFSDSIYSLNIENKGIFSFRILSLKNNEIQQRKNKEILMFLKIFKVLIHGVSTTVLPLVKTEKIEFFQMSDF